MAAGDGGSERVYRSLLRLYPAEFRGRFGDEMVQLFADQLRDARGDEARAGTARTWLRTLGDLGVTAAAEHARRDRTVAHSLAAAPPLGIRLLGLLGILGGLVLVAAFIIDIAPGLNFVRLVLFNAGAIAIGLALYPRLSARSRRLSVAVVTPLILANAWYLAMVLLSIGRPQFPEPDHAFRVVMNYASAAMWLTDAAFGFTLWRAGVASRWSGLGLGFGSMFGFLGIGALDLVTGDLAWFFSPAALAGIGVNGLAWILLGFDIARRRTVRAPTSEA